jgi:hypothetical protein
LATVLDGIDFSRVAGRGFPRLAKSASPFDFAQGKPWGTRRHPLISRFGSRWLNTLLEDIESESHRGLSLSSRAVTEFRRWLAQPDTPLASEAYVLLSNWFMTNSGDRNSRVAMRCETFWDALFPCRPLNRLSSPQPGRNHVVVEHEFQRFWSLFREADKDQSAGSDELPSAESAIAKASVVSPGRPDSTDNLRATLEKQGLRCHVEGSPQALADFLNRISGWDMS